MNFNYRQMSNSKPKILRLFVGLSMSMLIYAGCGKSSGDESDQSDSATITEAMSKEHKGDVPSANRVAWLEPAVEVESELIEVKVGERSAVAYLSVPESRTEQMPGIIVIHEWWGLNENVKAVSRRLAGEGIVALAVDLYGKRVAESPEDAQELMKEAMSNPESAEAILRSAMEFLKSSGCQRVGVIGWCFGGGWSLRTALAMPDEIEATVIYYGQLQTDPEQLSNLRAPVLGIFGSEDQGIPVEVVNQFDSALDSLGIENSINVYEGANHAFANPSGRLYNDSAASDAWIKTSTFLKKHLKN